MDQGEILHLGPALIYFFEHAEINIYQRNTNINLLDFFPSLREGYAFEDTIYNIFDIYVLLHDISTLNLLQFLSDDIFNQAFNSNIPAEKYIHESMDNNKSRSIISMNHAIEQGLINTAMNTYQVIKNSEYSDMIFENNEDFLYTVYKSLIKSLNVNNDFVYNYEIDIQELVNESKLAQELLTIIKNITKNKKSVIINNNRTYRINFSEFIFKAINAEDDYYNILYVIRDDPWLYLLYCIIISDKDEVGDNFYLVDTRFNDYEAYHLAYGIGDPEIIELIRDDIIKRNWIETQAIRGSFEGLIGPSDIQQVLFPYGTRI